MQEEVRVNSFGVLVVPPFECAWLKGEHCKLKNGYGCLSFQVVGERDCTLKLSSVAGGRRTTVDQGYTIVLGSHRNRKLKIEKNGQTVALIDAFDECKLVKGRLLSFWVALNQGSIVVGHNEPKVCNQILTYRDDANDSGWEELNIGLGSWDLHICYYTVQVTPHLPNDLYQQNVPMGIRIQDNNQKLQTPTKQVVKCLEDICAEVVCENLDMVSALRILKFCSINERVTNLTVQYVSLHFADILQEYCFQEFFQIPKETVTQIYNNENLCISEFQIFRSLIYWSYGFDLCSQQQQQSPTLKKPKSEVEELFSSIRIKLLDKNELEIVEEDSQSTEIQSILEEEKLQNLGIDRDQLVNEKRFVDLEALNWWQGFRRRIPPHWTALNFLGFGDGNGITSYLGTRYFQQTFVNPTICNSMKVTASGGSQVESRGIASFSFNEVCLAALDEQGEAWWQIDLGPQHLLVCDYYCLRQESSNHVHAHWQLQGSLDSTAWVTLQRHDGETSQAYSQGEYVGWEVVSSAAQNPYRYFRLFFTHPRQYYFNINNIEFYGFVKKYDV